MISFPEFYIVTGNIWIIGRECELESRATENQKRTAKKLHSWQFRAWIGRPEDCYSDFPHLHASRWHHFMWSDLRLTDVPYYYYI